MGVDTGLHRQELEFLRFLETHVWGVRENAPALAGTPETTILEPVSTT